ncbi:MAG: phosphate ABC transporter substrate-binding protein [Desulfovibrio sp.]|jgi:phosphate transport system substrate-binding protein|nr:phosphate ABC transporter substrate-binding protein [Desulfovibrio sp.]MDD7476807.1 phosphate ABC transporter substrate-binding protein [Desulfovibrio sp.]MDY5485213.1 phosphate ABC transporter substrate-binding protein [Desulfovibrio sp.]MEE0406750.1 phosphate ABC transporter substrate-binding protein [Desulfovibrio sp.]HAK22588.1 phosphate ABC transporter substrate-binding protein [Desulfovibrio sp.]
MSLSKIFAATVLSLAVASPAMAGQLVINGSTTVLPVMQKAGEAFMASHPDIQLSISGGGSGNGIKALMEGQCNIAMSSRDMKDKEKEACKAKNINPVRTTIAVDAIVPVVNPGNPLKEITSEQLKDIYAGKITNWKEVGGKDGKIVVVSRDSSSGTFECWNELIMKKERVAPSALMQASNGAVVQAVAKNPNAIGYIGLGYLNSSVKGLHVDKKEPTAQNALSKTWPISRELYIFTNGEPQGDAKALVTYLLDPTKGQKNVAEVGYIPLGK